MINNLYLFVVCILAIMLPVIGISLVVFVVNANKNRKVGFLHLMPYGLLLVIAADVLFSGRSLNNESLILHNELARSSIAGWLIRICSLMILLAAIERIVNFFINNKHPFGRNKLLTISFIIFWMGSVGLNGVFSSHPSFSHDYIYPLVMGVGLLVLSVEEVHLFLTSLRNALLAFVTISFIFSLLVPELVLQSNYAQGFIPGLPRMAGLSAHAIVFGVLSLILLILTIKIPYKSVRIQKVAITFAVVGLFMAQSKTVWVSSFQVLFVMILFHIRNKINGAPVLKSQLQLSFIASLIFVVCSLLMLFSAIGLVNKIELFFNSKEGAQLLSLTGRDIIWEYALAEWHNSPIFGYGPSFLSLNHRASLGLFSATHAHNEFVDLLARSGLVGLISVIPYLLIILMSLFKLHQRNKELAIVAFVILLNRCISEVPLSLYGYGHEFLIHMFMTVSLLTAADFKKR